MCMLDARRYRLATAWALVIGPALFLLDNLIHPEELGRGNEAEQLAAIAADPERWQIAHLIGFASLLAICVFVLGLAWIVRRTQPSLGLWAGAAGIAGAMGFAFAFALDGYTWGVLGEVSGRPATDAATIQAALGEVQESSWALPYYALAIVAFVGAMLALSWGLARGGWASARAAALLALGSLAVAIEGVIASNAYFIASSALLLVGGLAVARELLRVADGRLVVRAT
jgi:hypothetical protein